MSLSSANAFILVFCFQPSFFYLFLEVSKKVQSIFESMICYPIVNRSRNPKVSEI